eukprot:scaffold13160_cov81-Phaeocystis_antarctica.AAC.9
MPPPMPDEWRAWAHLVRSPLVLLARAAQPRAEEQGGAAHGAAAVVVSQLQAHLGEHRAAHERHGQLPTREQLAARLRLRLSLAARLEHERPGLRRQLAARPVSAARCVAVAPRRMRPFATVRKAPKTGRLCCCCCYVVAVSLFICFGTTTPWRGIGSSTTLPLCKLRWEDTTSWDSRAGHNVAVAPGTAALVATRPRRHIFGRVDVRAAPVLLPGEPLRRHQRHLHAARPDPQAGDHVRDDRAADVRYAGGDAIGHLQRQRPVALDQARLLLVLRHLRGGPPGLAAEQRDALRPRRPRRQRQLTARVAVIPGRRLPTGAVCAG